MKYIYLLLIISCFGCSDWLDVKPSDRIAEDAAFSNLAGFKQALNGVYVELNADALYGQTLTCEMTEILAQRYDINQENTEAYAFMEFDYTGASVEARLENTWGKAYNLIANTNLILKNCEEHREVLSDEYYNLIKGETLGLRAMLHFDLFRLFGPVYSEDSTLSSIPYYKEFTLNSTSNVPANLFMDMVISDLRQAETLLEEDPIITNGVAGNAADKFLQKRNLRLNYYAVQALLSRAYLYVGQKDSALYYANKIIEIQESKFPWVGRTEALMGEAPNRIFSSEVIFALENRNIGGVYSRYFDATTLKAKSLLGMRADVIEYRFDYEDNTDYRYAGSLKETAVVGGVSYCVFNKFQVGDSSYYEMMPMLRVSEAYLNAAEILMTEDPDQSNELLTVVREHRGLEGLYWDPEMSDIMGEWYREFIGEGQMFFFYKRNFADEMFSAREPYEGVSVTKTNYVLPIPDAENKYN